MTNNQDTGYINQAGQNYFDSFIFYFLKIGICLFLVSWYLVIQAPLAHAGAIIGRPLYLGLEQGLVGFWSFDGQDVYGDYAYDRSGVGNICYNGNICDIDGDTVTGIPGKIGQAYHFKDQGYIDLNGDAGSGHTFTPNNWSVSVWARMDAIPAGETFVFQNGDPFSSGGVSGFGIFFTSPDNKMNIWTVVGTNSEEPASTVASFPLAEWVHVTGIKNGTDLRLYINGALHDAVTLSSATMDYTSDSPVTRIGCISDLSNCWNGGIDELRIYNRALSPDEIRRLYRIGSTLTVGESKSTGTLQEGLVGFWSFDGPDMAGVTAFDRSGQGNNGTLTNGPRRTIGKIGQALEFDGTNDNVALTDMADNTSQLSAAMWLYQSSATIGKTAVSKYAGGSTNWYFASGEASCGGDLDFIWSDGIAVDACTTTDLHQAGRWEHWAFVYDGTKSGNASKIKIYFNGVQQTLQINGTVPASLPDTPDILRIGADSNLGAAFFWDGLIDDVRVYNRALSPDEIRRLYRIGSTLTVGESKSTGTLQEGLVGFWSFDGPDMAGVTAFDRSGQGNNGTLTNGPRRTIGKIGQALEFDGVNDRVEDFPSNTAFGNLAAVTASAWIRPRSQGQNDSGSFVASLSGQCQASPSEGWLFGFDGNWGARGEVCFAVDYSGANNLLVISNQNALPFNEWQHMVVTWDGSSNAQNVHIYRNGIEISYATQTNGSGSRVVAGSNAIIIGNDNSEGSSFDGTIDDVRVYNRALSPDEIRRLYQMGR